MLPLPRPENFSDFVWSSFESAVVRAFVKRDEGFRGVLCEIRSNATHGATFERGNPENDEAKTWNKTSSAPLLAKEAVTRSAGAGKAHDFLR